MVKEDKPIYLTEEQWDWLYDHLIDANENIIFFLNVYKNLPSYRRLEERLDSKTEGEMDRLYYNCLGEWLSSLKEYTYLFEKDIDSFFETIMPSESFRCVGCNKELEVRHMRVSVWSRDLTNESDESSQLVLDQKRMCISILKDQIYWIKTDKPDDGCWWENALDNWDLDLDRPKNTLPWNREKILMLLRNAYRKLGKTPLGHHVFLDPYTIRILDHLLAIYQLDYKGVTQIVEMLGKNISSQMEKPLCWRCSGAGVCHICNDDCNDDQTSTGQDDR